MFRLLLLVTIFTTLLFSKEYKVGFAQDTFANDWRLAQVNEVKKEASKYSFLKLNVRDAKASVANQISDIEYFIKNKYDFIITSPIDARITSLALKKAMKNGIKVVLIDRGVESSDYTTFITPDNILIAKQAAKYMVKKMNGKGTILMLEGVKGATPTLHRESGFESIMNNYPNINIIKRRANFLRADAINVMNDIYKSGIKFDAIYSHSDSMLSGVRTVMRDKGKDMSILMVGIDYISEAKEAILNGEQSASFTYPTAGKEGIENIVKIINGKGVDKNQIINSTMVTIDNVKAVSPIF